MTFSFLKVTSSLDEGSRRHVKDMKHHIVISEETAEEREIGSRDGPEGVIQRAERTEGESSNRTRGQATQHHEKKTGVAKPIALDDLFKQKSIKLGDPESEVRKVLLYGNPGSGKTCITRVVAHKWALGEMAQDFDAVYVVPVRDLNSTEYNGQKWTSPEEAISQICFSGGKHSLDSEDLVDQVELDLDDPSTMLMVDGLDEANDRAMELLSAVWDRSCKLLLLARPYNTRDVETRVDIRVECLGFDDEQLRDYIKSELSEDEAPRLIQFIEDSDALWEMAHTPATAHILCSLSKKHGTATEERRKRASIFQIYNDIVNSVWKRFEEKPTAGNVDKVEIFIDLEKIAFESLRKGLILIHESFVMKHATSKNAARTLKESGLLLSVLDDDQGHHFSHLTLQQYFAGKHIARILKQKGSEKERVTEFIQEEKYNQKHALTLSFATNALAQGRNKSALQQMLSLVDERPVEVLGIQHFFLKMRVLEASLEGTDESEMEYLLKDGQATKLVESARQLLKRTFDDVLIRKIVVQEFQQLSCVLEQCPQVLDGIIEEAKMTLAHTHYLTRKNKAKITDVLTLTKHSREQSDTIIKFLLQKTRKPGGMCNPEECIEKSSPVAEQLSHHVSTILPPMLKNCFDEDEDVRQAAISAIGSVVAASPQRAGDVLHTLVKGCMDEDSRVRQAAMSAIGSVVAASPQRAGDVLHTLVKGCSNENLCTRQAAMSAMGSVVAASPQRAGDVLPAVVNAGGAEYWHVRQSAMSAMGSVVAASPQLAGDVLHTLVKGCMDKESRVCQAAMSAMDSVVAASPQHAGDVLHTLVKGCKDEDSHVRQAAMSAMGSVVAASPQHAGDVLHTLVKGCKDEDSHVRQAAMSAMGSVVAASPQHAGDVLHTLVKGCGAEYWHVRQSAMSTIGSVVAASPQHAGDVLHTLVKGCKDEDSHVRQAAMSAMGSVVAASPQHAGDVLHTLVKGCGAEYWHVRQSAMSTIGSVVAASPQHAGDVLHTLVKGCKDEDSHVRQAAMSAMGSVVAASPQHAGDVLHTLVKGCGAEYWHVRQSAMSTIGSVVAASPQHAGDVLHTLVKGCKDEDSHVRQAAMSAMGSVVAASPQHAGDVLHTLVKGCKDEVWSVRRAAMSTIGNVVEAAPQHAGDVLPKMAAECSDDYLYVRRGPVDAINAVVDNLSYILSELLLLLKTGCEDNDFSVRQSAIEAVGKALRERQYLACHLLPMLASGCNDQDLFVRQTALEVICKVIIVAPDLAGGLLELLGGGCTDKVYFVRCTAIEVVGKVVGAAPHLADKLLPRLKKGQCDENIFVRLIAIEAVGSAVEAAPHLFGEVMPMLEKGCVDGHIDVRSKALKAIGGIVETAPHLVGELLPMLEKRFGKECFSVQRNPETTPREPSLDSITSPPSISALRNNLLLVFIGNAFTLNPLTQDNKVPIVLHAISSHEIGRWDRETLDRCLETLKTYFEEKFPGLLEYLVMRE